MQNNFSGSFDEKVADESSTLGSKLSDSTTQLKDNVVSPGSNEPRHFFLEWAFGVS